MEDQKIRRQKFVRRGTDAPLRLQARDVGLLKDVAEHRYLNTSQILALHEGSRRNLLERLSRLYHHGYLERPTVQKKTALPSSHLVYCLGRKGVEVLASSAEEREMLLRRIRENERTLPLLAHSLMISQFRVCLELALRDREDVKLSQWVQGYDLKNLLSKHGTPSLVPDAFLILETPTHRYPCFLEADRATMSIERFVSKLRLYWQHNRDEKFKDTLGIAHFRVLTITPSEGRTTNLCHASRMADDRHEGSLMYLFLSQTKYDMSNPEVLLQEVWRTAKNDDLHSFVG
jgi:hypothetical protein